jgi:hypothetical protein
VLAGYYFAAHQIVRTGEKILSSSDVCIMIFANLAVESDGLPKNAQVRLLLI